MESYELRGTLSAYANWAGISLDTAKKRNRRGKIVFCKKYPHLVDFVRSNAAVRRQGRPEKRNAEKTIQIHWRVSAAEYADLATRHRFWKIGKVSCVIPKKSCNNSISS